MNPTVRYRRGFIDQEARAADGPLRFVMSAPGEKRDGLELDMKRWNLEPFMRNPVAKWNHGYDVMRGDLPIGRWRNVRVNERQEMVGDLEFDRDDDFAREVESKYRRGFLNAVSIGFLYGNGRRDNELLEASAVAVPADPDAVVAGRSLVLTSREYADLQERLASLERMVQHERARAQAVDALRSL